MCLVHLQCALRRALFALGCGADSWETPAAAKGKQFKTPEVAATSHRHWDNLTLTVLTVTLWLISKGF